LHSTFVFVLIGFVVIVTFVWPLVSIQLRLSRNGKIAQQLVHSLEARFPGINFRGAANYEREVIYISVADRLDEATRLDVERWLREQKIEQKITPQIWLRFEGEDVYKQLASVSGGRDSGRQGVDGDLAAQWRGPRNGGIDPVAVSVPGEQPSRARQVSCPHPAYVRVWDRSRRMQTVLEDP
jgi:hypothetical protein